MQTVCETRAFRRAAEEAGLAEDDIAALVDRLANEPMAGDEIPGTGGCRKLRLAGRGKGKSGGYRVITFYSGRDLPLFLLTVFSKGERANLTVKECNALAALTKQLVEAYRGRS